MCLQRARPGSQRVDIVPEPSGLGHSMSFDQNGAKDGYRAAQRSLWRRLQDATSTAAGRAAYR